MARGGDFGAEQILHFNGGLFADAEVIHLTAQEINIVAAVNEYDWGSVEPSIFGTLFERTLDPGKRSQIGAHYTSRQDILTLLEPVLMAPLRREWEAVKKKCEEKLWPAVEKAGKANGKRGRAAGKSKERKAYDRQLQNFAERLTEVTVLDPACGSGNFLYVAINLLLDLEKEVIAYAAWHGLTLLPHVRPTQLSGLEINPYAQELAQVVIWIGYLQWMHHNGFKAPSDPVLEPIESIHCTDAILDLCDPENPREPEWPKADFIVGNPPFLGNKQLRSGLGEEYISSLWRMYGDRLPATSNLCCYWFEKARAIVASRKDIRAGLLATTTMTQVSSRKVLERIGESCRIFFAISDRDWVLDGASVRISMVGFTSKEAAEQSQLDGQIVPQINSDLTSRQGATKQQRLQSRLGLCFMGTTKVGDFDIEFAVARELLNAPNPDGRPNSDVLRPFRNGSDLVRVCSDRWVIDYGTDRSMSEAALYESPFQYLIEHVKPFREKNNRKTRAEHWWLLGETIPAFRKAVSRHHRYLGTARVAKHRVFVWLDTVALPDSKVIALAFDGDCHLGLLQSRVHTVWTLATCGWHGVGNDATYNPTACFETFPFPVVTPEHEAAIGCAAKKLDELRNRWLNPPEWTKTEVLEFPGSIDGPWARYVDPASVSPLSRSGRGAGGEGGIGTVRWPRIVPKDPDCAESLKKRTLTSLYNQRPAWLDLAHRKLDAAVFAAYGWAPSISDDELLERLLALNLERVGKEAD
jgi:SAM-dependent methyltransferase